MKKILFCVYFGLTVIASHAEDTKHVVKNGEGLYAIARKYNIKVDAIIKANPGLVNNDDIKIGQTLVIPAGNSVSTPVAAAPRATPRAKDVPAVSQPVKAKVHTVVKGEGLFAICKKYNATVADVRKWNSLATDNVRIGQKLIVAKENSEAIYKPVSVPSTPDTPYTQEDIRPRTAINPELINASASLSNEPVLADKPKMSISAAKVEPVVEPAPVAKPSVAESLKTASSNPDEYSGIFNNYSALGFKVKRNRGAANYLTDNTSGNQYLAFYSNAESGSIIRVTNMMNNKTIYAKVVGKVPPADAASEVVVKMSNTAANALGAMDEKFLVEVTSYAEAK